MNVVSEATVERLILSIEPHPKPYKVAWINSTFIPVTERCLVSISCGQYNDSIWCDVIPMTVTHILLGCPWLYDQDVYHIEEDNTYKFMFNNAQIVLKSMSAEQLEQLRQKQKVKPKDAAETPKQSAILQQKGVGELEQDQNKFDHGKVDTKEDIGVLAMEIIKKQGEHKIDLGKIKMKEDIDVTTIDQSKKSFKLNIPWVIDFIIPN